ncbi:MAG: helix-turn-helix transcriptional regulator [Oscillospiraceae bacterium]|nr:helix-turn-helix transcriptional regulator [Oscillospiraceae bacterium]
MTLGEKLKKARWDFGLSQEELAVRLGVSRQAVSKWEADKGIPDILNLKAISSLLDVSLDYLLDDGTNVSKSVLKEPIDLTRLKKTKHFARESLLMLQRYPEADAIYLLARERVLSGKEKAADEVIGWTAALLGGLPLFGTFQMADTLRDLSGYYLVDQGERQFFVNVRKDFLLSEELPEKITTKKFIIGENQFRRLTDLVPRKGKWPDEVE